MGGLQEVGEEHEMGRRMAHLRAVIELWRLATGHRWRTLIPGRTKNTVEVVGGDPHVVRLVEIPHRREKAVDALAGESREVHPRRVTHEFEVLVGLAFKPLPAQTTIFDQVP